MAEEEYEFNGMGSEEEGGVKANRERPKRQKNLKKKQVEEESMNTEKEQALIGETPHDEGNRKSSDLTGESGKKKRKKKFQNETLLSEEDGQVSDVSRSKIAKKQRKGELLEECDNMVGKEEASEGGVNDGKIEAGEEEISKISVVEDGKVKGVKSQGNKHKRRLLNEAAKADKRGVCYLSRIPPRLDHVIIRQILSQYGEVQRIYITPLGSTAQAQRKRGGKSQLRQFCEGWVEFADKKVAKRVASMLNNEQIGGRKRSQFYYDTWNIKYLSKFKWSDLNEEIALKNKTREKKLALELQAAKRETEFYESKHDQYHTLNRKEEEREKKQNAKEELEAQMSNIQQPRKVLRQFAQTKPVLSKAEERKPLLSKDILAGVFSSS